MAHKTSHLELTIDAPVHKVFDALADPHVFIGNDPIVSAVYIHERRINDQHDPVIEYDVIETPRLLWLFPLRLTVHAISTSSAATRTIQNVVSSPLQMANTITLREQNQKTLLSETIDMTASPLLIGYSMRQALLAHEALFRNLKAKLESVGGT